jgi:hypothetical protein
MPLSPSESRSSRVRGSGCNLRVKPFATFGSLYIYRVSHIYLQLEAAASAAIAHFSNKVVRA